MAGYAGIHTVRDGQGLRLRNASLSRPARVDSDAVSDTTFLRWGARAGVSNYSPIVIDTIGDTATPTGWTDANSNLTLLAGNYDAEADEQATAVTRDNVWIIEPNTSSGVHRAEYNTILDVGYYYRLRVTYFLKATNTTVAGFVVGVKTGTASTVNEFNTVGKWVTEEVEFRSDGADIYIDLSNGLGTTTLTGGGTGDDRLRIHRFTVQKIGRFVGSVNWSKDINGAVDYDADWSAGVNGWSGDGAYTVSSNQTIVDDNGESRSGCIQWVYNGTNTQHLAFRNLILTVGVRYVCRFGIYIDAANTSVDGFRFQATGTTTNWNHADWNSTLTTVPGRPLTLGVWHDLSFEFEADSVGMVLNPMDGASLVFAGDVSSGGIDRIALSNISFTRIVNHGVTEFDDISGAGFEIFHGNEDGVTDDDGVSEDNCLKVSLENNSGDHAFEWADLFEIGKSYRMIMRAYIQSTNSNFNGIYFQTGSTGVQNTIEFPDFVPDDRLGKWTTYAKDFRATGKDARFLPTNNGNTTLAGSNGPDLDTAYFSELCVIELEHPEMFYPNGFNAPSDYQTTDVDGGLGNIVGNSDSVTDNSATATYNDVLAIQINSSGTHRIRWTGALEVGVEYRLYCVWWLPNANTHCDGLDFENGDGTDISQQRTAQNGTWRTTTATFTAVDTAFQITPMDDTSDTFTPSGTDFLYIAKLCVVPNKPEIGATARAYTIGTATRGSNPSDLSTIDLGFLLSPSQPEDESGQTRQGLCFWYDTSFMNPCWIHAPYRTREFTSDESHRLRFVKDGALSTTGEVLGSDTPETVPVFGNLNCGNLEQMPIILSTFTSVGSVAAYLSGLQISGVDTTGTELEYSEADLESDMLQASVSFDAGGANPQLVNVVLTATAAYTASSYGTVGSVVIHWPSEDYELYLSGIYGNVIDV